MRLRVRVVGVALGAAVALALIAGCTQRQGSAGDQLLPTTTTSDRSSTTEGSATASTLAGQTADQIRSALDAAVSARDFCALTVALDNAVPDAKDGPSIIATYESLDSAVKAAVAFRPPQLADSWTLVVAGVGEGLDAARRVGGNLSDPALRAPFTAGDFEAAMTSVESWADSNCTTR